VCADTWVTTVEDCVVMGLKSSPLTKSMRVAGNTTYNQMHKHACLSLAPGGISDITMTCMMCEDCGIYVNQPG
jgi:hypothetical protein